jgi:predicted nuclease of predicted toxin-antitoxin system
MKLLLDENLPVKLKYRFIDKGFDAYTVRDMNWLGKENGELFKPDAST